MPYVCPLCQENPRNHSFSRIHDTNEFALFYSCPGDAIKYSDNEGIIEHIDGTLRELDGKPWKWIIDGNGFTMKHAMQVNLAISIIRLCANQYSTSLQQILVINPSGYVHTIISVVWPLLSESMKAMIVMKN